MPAARHPDSDWVGEVIAQPLVGRVAVRTLVPEHAGDHDIPALTLRPEVAPGQSGFNAHQRPVPDAGHGPLLG